MFPWVKGRFQICCAPPGVLSVRELRLFELVPTVGMQSAVQEQVSDEEELQRARLEEAGQRRGFSRARVLHRRSWVQLRVRAEGFNESL